MMDGRMFLGASVECGWTPKVRPAPAIPQPKRPPRRPPSHPPRPGQSPAEYPVVRWLVTCSCGWERECSSEWAARSVSSLHPQLAPVDVPLLATRDLPTEAAR
jgi:hypothetical protein